MTDRRGPTQGSGLRGLFGTPEARPWERLATAWDGFTGTVTARTTALEDTARILFVHIPRTGGTSIEELLEQHLPGEVFPGYSDGAVVTSPQRRLRRHDVYVGHQLYYIRDLIRPDFTFTFLRHPVERARSLWALMHETQPETVADYDGFMDCARSFAHMQNHQTRFLAASYDVRRARAQMAVGERSAQAVRDEVWELRNGAPVGDVELAMAKAAIDDMQFVGIFEDFDPAVRALFDRLHAPVDGPLPRSRRATRRKAEIAPVTPEERAELRDVNRLDLALYHHARRRYEAETGRSLH